MNSKRRYIYVDSSSGTATSSIPYQSPSPQEALRGRYGNNDCYTFPMTKPSSVGLSEACYRIPGCHESLSASMAPAWAITIA